MTLDAIDATRADVLLLQEITPAWEHFLREHLIARYPHASFHVSERAAGFAVMSRLPLAVDDRLGKPDGAFYHGHRLVVTTASGPLQILHIHLRAPIHDDCFTGQCSDLDWVKGAFTTPPIRLREIEEHWTHVDRALPTIVAGDFNELPAGGVMKFLEQRGMQRIVSSGPPTWHEARDFKGERQDILAGDIDHVMVDAHITPIDATVFDAGASDHRPLLARVRVR